MSDEASSETRDLARKAGLVATASLIWGFLWFTISGHDDCHITYWASYSLSEFGEIVNYSGQRVEQSSSLLHTLVLALGNLVTPWSIPTLGFFLGLLCAWLAVFRLIFFSRALGGSTSPTALAVCALSGPWLYWAMGGLETTLVSWVLLEFAIAVHQTARDELSATSPRAVAVLLAMVWVRPEGYFVVASALVGVILARHFLAGEQKGRGAHLKLLAISTALFALTTAWRHSYFDGALFPQPVQVKFDGAVGNRELTEGFRYLWAALKRPDVGATFLVTLGLGGLAFKRGGRPQVDQVCAALIAGAYLAFIAAVGGDWMEASRFLVHAWPLLALLFLLGMKQLERQVARHVIAGVLVLATVWSTAGIAGEESAGSTLPKLMQVDPILVEESGEEFAWTERARLGNIRDVLFFEELDLAVSALIEADAAGGKPIKILSGQAGMLMYHLAVKHYGKFEYIDRFALSSLHLIPLVKPCKLPGGHYGLRLKTETYFKCIKKEGRDDLFPDLIFDIRVHHMKSAKKRKMKVVHHQHGDITSWRYPGKAGAVFKEKVPAFEFVAVRREHAKLVPPIEPRKFNWNARKAEALDQ